MLGGMSRPNILLLISHDLGTHIGPYGQVVGTTPTLDRLASEGVLFEHHFVTSPGCSQSRSSLITGRYPHANGQFGLAHLGWELHRDEETLPAALRRGGYRTALFGIWHLHEWTLAGFDEVSDDVSVVDSSPEGHADVASTRAAAWLKRNAGCETPFYLHVGFWEAHRPFCGQPGDSSRRPELDTANVVVPDYLPDNEATRTECAHLRESVKSVDAGVASILEALAESGQAANTLVLFTADHGLPFPRAKGTLYDPGIQVPLLARWPGRIPAGQRCDGMTSNVDVMPTLLEIAGSPASPRIQGESFAALLRDGTGAGRAEIYAEKTYHEHYDPIRCIRTRDAKYIRNFAERPALVMPSDIYNSPTRRSMTADEQLWGHRPREEFYDLTADCGERNNLAGTDSRLVELRERLNEWMVATGDPLCHGPVPRPSKAPGLKIF